MTDHKQNKDHKHSGYTDAEIEAVCEEFDSEVIGHAAARLILDARRERDAAKADAVKWHDCFQSTQGVQDELKEELRAVVKERDEWRAAWQDTCDMVDELVYERDAALAVAAKYRNMAPFIMVNKVEPELAREIPPGKRTSTVGALVDRIAELEADAKEMLSTLLSWNPVWAPRDERIAALEAELEQLRSLPPCVHPGCGKPAPNRWEDAPLCHAHMAEVDVLPGQAQRGRIAENERLRVAFEHNPGASVDALYAALEGKE